MASRAAIAPRVLTDNAADTIRAIGIVSLAYVMMTLGDVAAKWALASTGVALLMVARGVTGILPVLTAVAVDHGWSRLLPRRPGLVLLRCLMHVACSSAWYIAWLFIPLADTYALGFTSPLVMTLLAVPMLGERIRWRRILSTLIGFSGVLLMVRPGGAMWRPELLVMVPGVLGLAISRILSRTLSTTETPECLTFWLMIAHIPIGLAALAWGVGPTGPFTPDIWIAMVLLGMLNGIGQLLIVRAYGLAPVAVLAPYEYTTMIYGLILGWLAFGEWPAPWTLAGAGVVSAAGLYNLHRERMRRAQAAR